MPSDSRILNRFRRIPMRVRLGVLFLAWLVFIGWMHYRLNFKPSERQVVTLG